ncbi:MAG: ferritin-like domain-containing protein, partial [Ramlibacter sp.]|nr:ferritin-like domain-containing protein [Ramlibacter sp.]
EVHRAPRPRGPFNLAARRQAGFDEAELAVLLEPALAVPTIPV